MKKIAVILALTILSVYGMWIYSRGAAGPFQTKLTHQEKIKVDTLLQNMTTRCIGRYLVDLPASYTPSEKGSITVNDSEITTQRLYLPAFEQRIRLREQELLTKKTVDPMDMPFIKNKYPLPSGLKGIIFERGESVSRQDASRILEAHIYSNGVAIKIELEAMNGLDKRYDKYREESPRIYGNQVPDKLLVLNKLLLRVQGRAEYEIPTKPGNCIQNAFVMDNKKDQESIHMLYKSNNASQLRFGISTNNFIREDDSLLERSGEIGKNLSAVNGYLLRKGKREINGLYTEELLAKGSYSPNNNNDRYDFILLMNEKVGGLKTPVFSLELLNDELTPSPYNQEEIISFWDAVSQTVRLRPGAF